MIPQYTVFLFLYILLFFAHLIIIVFLFFLHILFAHPIVFLHIVLFFCTSYCFALFYFIAHFTLISPFLTTCMPLCYVTLYNLYSYYFALSTERTWFDYISLLIIPCITIMWQIKKPWTLNLDKHLHQPCCQTWERERGRQRVRGRLKTPLFLSSSPPGSCEQLIISGLLIPAPLVW